MPTDRWTAAASCVDKVIDDFHLEQYLESKAMDRELAINELKDYVEEVRMYWEAIDADHVRASFKGAALYALMGFPLPGDGKEDIDIPGEVLSAGLLAAGMPAQALAVVPFSDIKVFYWQRISELFEDEKFNDRKAMEKMLQESWIKSHNALLKKGA